MPSEEGNLGAKNRAAETCWPQDAMTKWPARTTQAPSTLSANACAGRPESELLISRLLPIDRTRIRRDYRGGGTTSIRCWYALSPRIHPLEQMRTRRQRSHEYARLTVIFGHLKHCSRQRGRGEPTLVEINRCYHKVGAQTLLRMTC